MATDGNTPAGPRTNSQRMGRGSRREWAAPIRDWAKILNQLAIRFEGRFEL